MNFIWRGITVNIFHDVPGKNWMNSEGIIKYCVFYAAVLEYTRLKKPCNCFERDLSCVLLRKTV